MGKRTNYYSSTGLSVFVPFRLYNQIDRFKNANGLHTNAVYKL